MPLFDYRAADGAGNIIQGSLEAREERQVVQQLHQGGLVPLRITTRAETSGWNASWWGRRTGRVSLGEVVNLTQELAALLKAGLPLDRSLQVLKDVTKRPGLRNVLTLMVSDLQSGKPLSEALARHRIFSPLYVSLVQAGETGGFLEEALSRLADYLRTVSELRNYLITALIYPIILATMASVSLLIMLLYVVPSFEVFFKELGQSLYWSTRMLLGLSQAFRSYWWVGVLLGLAGFLALLRLARTERGRLALDRLKIRAPILGDLTRQIAAAFFAKTLGTLLNSGVPLVSGLKVVTTSVTNRALANSLSGVLEEVKKGQPLSLLLRKGDLFPELFLQMIAIGEETGHLADMLLSAAENLENGVRTQVRRLLALLEPVLILTMALLVAFIIISLLLPILNLYEFKG
jgi:general secretion pathway protein F